MSRNSQRPKGTEETPISECDEAERNQHKQDSLLVDMPTEQEGSIST